MKHKGLNDLEMLFAESPAGMVHVAQMRARHEAVEAGKGVYASEWTDTLERRAIVEGAAEARRREVADWAAQRAVVMGDGDLVPMPGDPSWGGVAERGQQATHTTRGAAHGG